MVTIWTNSNRPLEINYQKESKYSELFSSFDMRLEKVAIVLEYTKKVRLTSRYHHLGGGAGV